MSFRHIRFERDAEGVALAVAWTMRAVDVGLNTGIEKGLRYEATAFGLAAASDDRRSSRGNRT